MDDSRRAAVLATILANVHRDAKRQRSAYKPEDFFPELKTERVGGQSVEQQIATARHITALFQQAEALKRGHGSAN